MIKPSTINGYSSPITEACERVLVTLLRGLGPYKQSIYLVGGLTPRYLVRARPPTVPPHAGTSDIDIVVDLSILADTKGYSTLEDNLRRMGFERAENAKGEKMTWRWQTRVDMRTTLVIEFLADVPESKAGRLQPLPTDGNISAINIPHASMVFDLHDEAQVTAELLGDNGQATESVLYADLVSFTCLKAFAFAQRAERKDAHDLVYCLEHAEDGANDVADKFQAAMTTKHQATIREALGLLAKHFCDDANGDGYLKDGPVAAARFEAHDEEDRDRRILRQRQASEVVRAFLSRLELVS